MISRFLLLVLVMGTLYSVMAVRVLEAVHP